MAAWATGSVPDAAGSVVAETLDSEELVDAAKAGDGPLVAALLARFASVNSIDGKARGPLHAACKHGKAEVAEMLIEAAADLEMQTEDRIAMRPLHCAALAGSSAARAKIEMN